MTTISHSFSDVFQSSCPHIMGFASGHIGHSGSAMLVSCQFTASPTLLFPSCEGCPFIRKGSIASDTVSICFFYSTVTQMGAAQLFLVHKVVLHVLV